MRILTIAAAVLTTAAASGALAAGARLSDSQFVKAAHCRGLASGAEAAKLDALLKVQKRGRSDHVVDRAYSVRADAERLVRKAAEAGGGAEIARELSTTCAAFIG